MKGKTIRIV